MITQRADRVLHGWLKVLKVLLEIISISLPVVTFKKHAYIEELGRNLHFMFVQ
jgi:hypothetical protein